MSHGARQPLFICLVNEEESTSKILAIGLSVPVISGVGYLYSIYFGNLLKNFRLLWNVAGMENRMYRSRDRRH